MWAVRTAGEGRRQGKYARGTRLRSLATIIQVKGIIRGLLRLRIAPSPACCPDLQCTLSVLIPVGLVYKAG